MELPIGEYIAKLTHYHEILHKSVAVYLSAVTVHLSAVIVHLLKAHVSTVALVMA